MCILLSLPESQKKINEKSFVSSVFFESTKISLLGI
jgi:hypothetical protein